MSGSEELRSHEREGMYGVGEDGFGCPAVKVTAFGICWQNLATRYLSMTFHIYTHFSYLLLLINFSLQVFIYLILVARSFFLKKCNWVSSYRLKGARVSPFITYKVCLILIWKKLMCMLSNFYYDVSIWITCSTF